MTRETFNRRGPARLGSPWVLAFLLAVVVAWGTVGSSWAATGLNADQSQFLQQVETEFYLATYEKQPVEARLSRIEETVFGQAQPNTPTSERINRLRGVVVLSKEASTDPFAPLNPNPPAAAAQAPAAAPTQPVNAYTPPADVVAAMGTPAREESDYPAVSEMEQKVFGKSYAKEDLAARLNRLEDAVFQARHNGTLAERTDGLRVSVLGSDALSERTQSAYSAQNGRPVVSQAPAGYNPYNPYQPAPSAASAYSPGYSGVQKGYDPTVGYPANGAPGYAAQQPVAYQPVPQQTYPAYNPTAAQPMSQSAQGIPGYQPPTQGYAYPSASTPASEPYPYSPPPGVDYSGTQVASASPSYDPYATTAMPSADVMAALDEVEDRVLKQSYAYDPVNVRLDRLETKVFGTTSPELPAEDRLQRVIAVAAADGHNYDSNATKAKSTMKSVLPIILMVLPLLLL